MYSGNGKNITSAFRRNIEGRIPRPQPITRQAEPEGRTPRPQPMAPRWFGSWKPQSVRMTRTMGSLNDPTSSDPESYAPAPATVSPSPWSSLWSGLASIVTPAAQALAQVKATALVNQQQQKALAQTWNPTNTAPAIQAQAWQTAFQTGAGTPPLGISGTTLALGAAAIVGLVLITRK